jgi:hypothetical protein
VERLIAFLDALSGEPDLEDGGDDEPSEDPEPSLGWTDMESRYSVRAATSDIDAELDEADDEDGDPGEDNGDLEPSLAGFQLTSGKADIDLEFDDAELHSILRSFYLCGSHAMPAYHLLKAGGSRRTRQSPSWSAP